MVSSDVEKLSSTNNSSNSPHAVKDDNEPSFETMFLPVVSDEVVHLKVASHSTQLEEPLASLLKSKLKYRMWAYKGVGRSTSIDSCYPVVATALNDNDFKFKLQPKAGTYTTEPYVVFKTRVPDYRDATFIFYFEDDNSNSVASAIFSFDKASQSQGAITLPLVGPEGRIGSFTIDFVVIRPFKSRGIPEQLVEPSQLMTGSAANNFKELSRRKVVHSGHRGLGVGIRNDVPGKKAVTENTVYSFNYATRHGADMVELDVSLTKDKDVVVYHDLEVVHYESKEIHEIAELTLADLLSNEYLPVLHDTWRKERDDKSSAIQSFRLTDPDLAMFPLLRTVLQRVSHGQPINIEVKYPYPILRSDQKDTWTPGEPRDINEYLDVILSQTFAFAGNRPIVFSSFGVDICSALRLKQTKYPVMLLIRNQEYFPPTRDHRQADREMGIRFASADHLHGVNCFGNFTLSKGAKFVDYIRKNLNLLVYTWEGPLDVTRVNQLIDMKVDGICYDEVDLKKPHTKGHDHGKPYHN